VVSNSAYDYIISEVVEWVASKAHAENYIIRLEAGRKREREGLCV